MEMQYTNPKIQEVNDAYEKDKETLSYEDLKQSYLGKNGKLQELLKMIGSLSKEERSSFGKEANTLKGYITESLEKMNSKEQRISNYDRPLDVSAPYEENISPETRPDILKNKSSRHPLNSEMERVLRIFYEMGFNVEESRQLDDDYHMFESLNFPVGHPARDNWDTFWTEEGLIPPAHTSTMQNRVLKKYDLPVRVVIPGRCFRNEATDAGHEHTLHQVEGVYVDEGISLGDMIGTIQTYLEAFFEKKLEVKLQPAFFPFTEPDLEFLISCPFCNKKGCSTCGYTGWIEIMGCGMIHPNVLSEAGIDPEKYTGFAWGFGLDRLVMIKHGIEDIRWLQSGDLGFLQQFR